MTVTLKLLAWILVLGIAFATLSPIGLRPTTAAPADVERFVAYVLLAAVMSLAYPRHVLRCLLITIVLATGLESLQLIDPGRHGHLHDALIKIGGAMGGALVGLALTRLRGRAYHWPG